MSRTAFRLGRYLAMVTQGRTPPPPSSTPGRFGPAAGGEDGPFPRARWKSPVRGPWLTSVFGLVLLIGIPIEFLTGLLSYAAYNPRLGNDPNPDHGLFGFYLQRSQGAPHRRDCDPPPPPHGAPGRRRLSVRIAPEVENDCTAMDLAIWS